MELADREPGNSCSAMRQHISMRKAPAEVQAISVSMSLLTDSALVC